MSLLVGELFAHLMLEKKEFSAALKEAQAESAVAGRGIGANLAAAGKVAAVGLLAVGAVAAVVGVEGAKMAVQFQEAMELVQTQAGASAEEVHHLSDAILGMAADVGTGPEKLAEGIYHIESAGIRGAKALDVLHTAALGAKVGNADLEATTNALIAEVNSGISGVNGMSEAMGVLNGIVGAGNMRMDDLASSMASGVLSVAKQFGVSIQSLGASLATLTDQGVPAVDAATKLKTAIIQLGAPTGATAKQFESIGLSTRALAEELRSPRGMVGALQMLKEHMDAAGLDAIAQAQLLATAFGKRGGPAIMTLVNSLDMLKTKEEQITGATGGFQDAVDAMEKTTAFKLSQMGAAFDSIAIQIGNALLPVINDLVDGFTTLLKSQELQGVFAAVGQAAQVLAGALGFIAGVVGGVVDFFNQIGLTGPIVVTVLGAIALAFGAWAVAAAAAAVGTIVAFAPVIAVIAAVAGAIFLLEKAFEAAGTNIGDVAKAIGGAVIGFAKGVIGTLLNLAAGAVHIAAMIPGPWQDAAKSMEQSLNDMRHNVDQWGTDTQQATKDALQGIAKDIGDMFGIHIPQAVSDGMSSTVKNIGDALLSGRYEVDKNGKLVMKAIDDSVKEGGKEIVGTAAGIGSDMGEQLFDEFGNEVDVVAPEAATKTVKLIEQFGATVHGVIKAQGQDFGSTMMSEYARAIIAAENEPKDAFDQMLELMKKELTPAQRIARDIAEATSKALGKGLSDKRPGVRAQAQATKDAILEDLRRLEPNAHSIGKKGMEQLRKGMKSKDPDIRRTAKEIYDLITKPIAKIQTQTHGWGYNAMKNFIAGLESQQHHLEQVASRLAGAVGSYLKVSSPAEKGPMSVGGGPEGWGQRVGTLFTRGLRTTMPDLAGAFAMPRFGMPTLASAGAASAAIEESTGGRSTGRPGGETHYHYEVKVQGLVKARDPFEIAQAQRRVSTVVKHGTNASDA